MNLDEAERYDYASIVQSSSVTLDLDALAWSLQAPANFTVGVRVLTAVGHKSAFSAIKTIELQPVPATICATSSSYQYLCIGDCVQCHS